MTLVLALSLLLNALLTLFAGIRLWGHIFWRAGHEGSASETRNPDLRPLGKREVWLGLGSVAVLTAIVLVAGVLPGTILELGRSAAVDLLDPAPYIAATRLAGAGP